MVNSTKKINCFAVFADVENYAMLQESALELIMQIDEPIGFYGTPLLPSWSPMEVSWFFNPEEKFLPRPDIAAFGSTAFAASEAICDKLRPYISNDVEYLPIHVDGELWYIIHVLTRIDILNEELSIRKTRADGSVKRGYKKLVLDADKVIGNMLFRVLGITLNIYCTNKPGGFIDIVNNLGITGVIFNELD